MNLEDALQTKGLQKLLKKGLQNLYKPKCWLRGRCLQAHSDGHVIEEILTLVSYSMLFFL